MELKRGGLSGGVFLQEKQIAVALARDQGHRKSLFLLSEAGALSACLYAGGSDPGEGDK